MRWIKIFLLVVLLFAIPVTISAGTSQDVTITAVGFIVGVPGDFTLTYVNDTTVGMSWTKAPGAGATMVRVRSGTIPESRTDGYLVYSGSGTYFEDTSANLLGSEILYYRAWSQNATTSVWEEGGTSAEGNFMTQGYMMIGLIIVALGATFFAFRSTAVLFRIGCAGLWLTVFLFFLEVQESFVVGWSSNWFIALALSLFCMIVAILLMYMGRTIESGWLVSRPKDKRSRSQRATEDYADALHMKLYNKPKKRRQ